MTGQPGPDASSVEDQAADAAPPAGRRWPMIGPPTPAALGREATGLARAAAASPASGPE